MPAPQSQGHSEISSHSLEDLAFQESLAVDAASAFLQGLQNTSFTADPGMSAPLTGAEAHHDPAQSTGPDHLPADTGLSLPDPVTGSGHDASFVLHDFAGAQHNAHFDPGAFFH